MILNEEFAVPDRGNIGVSNAKILSFRYSVWARLEPNLSVSRHGVLSPFAPIQARRLNPINFELQ